MIEVMATGRHYLARVGKGQEYALEIAAIKAVHGRRYSTANKWWEIPLSAFESEDAFKKHLAFNLQVERERRDADKKIKVPPLDVPIRTKMELYPFQKEGVAYLCAMGSALLADQQGLGKTVQAIAAVATLGALPCLVIAKKSLLHNWKSEIGEWTDLKPIIFKDDIKASWHAYFQTGMANVGIVNYEGLDKYFVEGISVPDGQDLMVRHIRFRETAAMFNSIIIDESHYIKDGRTKRTKIAIGLAFKKPHVFCLSGTPVLNDAKELYPQLAALNRAHLFGTKAQFEGMYSGRANKHSLPLLNSIMAKYCYLRRTKAEVLTDLPAKTRQVIRCELTNRAEYENAEMEFKSGLKKMMEQGDGGISQAVRAQALTKMMHLKLLAARGKMETVCEWAEEMHYNKEKVVLFGFHKEITEGLSTILPGTVRLCASADISVLEERKKTFQTDPSVPAVVCSLSADAEGHTLTAASYLGMVELPWHFGKAEQCEDRIHRIGQEYPVTIAYFIAEGTIDEYIYNIIMEKKEMHNMVTGTTDQEAPVSYIDKLINLFNQK